MKKPILISLVLLAALAIGFVVGQNMAPIEHLKIVKEQVVDTVYKEQVIKIPYKKEVKTVDTVFIALPDTSAILLTVESNDSSSAVLSSNSDDSLQINKDERIKVETLVIDVIVDEIGDTLLEKLLDVEPVKQKEIVTEYWDSPINYKGYKLSKTKLIVYGVTAVSKSSIYKNDYKYYLKANNLFYELEETVSFKSLITIPKPEFIYD